MAKFEFEYKTYASPEELSTADKKLVDTALDAACQKAYAPYSNFYVGAAIELENGEIISGGNQENAASPAGICAERVALSAASALQPNKKILTLSIAYKKANLDSKYDSKPLSPCGICRQTIAEYTSRQGSAIRLLLCSANGQIIEIDNALNLLPMQFGSEML